MSISILAGHYDIWWKDRDTGAVDSNVSDYKHLGMTGSEGIRTNQEINTIPIAGDRFGETDVDGVFSGQNLTLEWVLQEVNKDSVQNFLSWYRNSSAATEKHFFNEMGQVGNLISSLAGTLKIAPRVNTTSNLAPGNNQEATRYYKGVNVSPIQEILATEPNFIPVSFKAYPFYDSNNNIVMFEWGDSPDAYPSAGDLAEPPT